MNRVQSSLQPPSWSFNQSSLRHSLQDSFARVQEAERLRQQGQYDRAETICEALVRKYPDYMAALHTLGLVFADQHRFEEALDCLVRAAMLNPAQLDYADRAQRRLSAARRE